LGQHRKACLVQLVRFGLWIDYFCIGFGDLRLGWVRHLYMCLGLWLGCLRRGDFWSVTAA
jgi:hypothetical protein